VEKPNLAHPDALSFFMVVSSTTTRLTVRFVGMAWSKEKGENLIGYG
jgi:hypothetical protein